MFTLISYGVYIIPDTMVVDLTDYNTYHTTETSTISESKM